MEKESLLDFFLDYECRSSWWCSWIFWGWGQELAGRYFAWKVARKFKRYERSKLLQEKIETLRSLKNMSKLKPGWTCTEEKLK